MVLVRYWYWYLYIIVLKDLRTTRNVPDCPRTTPISLLERQERGGVGLKYLCALDAMIYLEEDLKHLTT